MILIASMFQLYCYLVPYYIVSVIIIIIIIVTSSCV